MLNLTLFWMAAAATAVFGLQSLSQINNDGSEPWEFDDFEPPIPDDVLIEDYSLAISFQPGAATLGDLAEERLASFLEDLSGQDDLDVLYVAVWSDQDYPATGKSLGAAQLDLAKSRIEKITAFIKDGGFNPEVEYFNMAARAGFWAGLFGTSDALLKRDVAGDKADLEPCLQAIAHQARPGVAVFSAKFTIENRALTERNVPKPPRPGEADQQNVH